MFSGSGREGEGTIKEHGLGRQKMAIEVVFIFFFRILGDREAKKLLK